MEVNTPNKTQITSTPQSQFENSPVFDYINNLSPIELVKSTHTDQTLNSLSFVSPLPVFASPQLVSQREGRSIIRRCQFLEPSKPEPSQSKDDTTTSEEVLEAVKQSDSCADQLECFTSGSSAKGVTSEEHNKQLELAVQLPKALTYDCASPDGNVATPNAFRTHNELEMSGNSNERRLRRIYRIEQTDDEAGCDWVSLISDVADILNFESSVIEEQSDEQNIVDPGTISFVSNVLEIPHDGTSDLENIEFISHGCSSEEIEMRKLRIQTKEFGEQKEAEAIPTTLCDTLANKLVVNDANAEVDVKGKKCSQSSSKQNKIRRRCLVFEMAGNHKKKPACDSSTNVEKHVIPRDTERGKTLSAFSGRGIGLHLNALATGSRDGKVVKIETLSSGKPEINLVPSENEDKIVESALQISMVVNEDLGIESPRTKRPKLEYVGAACKRCNCKRSKCLKLYCECFAAGLYCIEPCSCQGCFNKPAHEDTVLETRKQIEARNPLAFAPKVIRSMDSASEFGDESNKTPASARHKRGCNCKKSSCLKKYCECFQGGVGCSTNCRCEGCKNTFGTKNGIEENSLEGNEFEVGEKNVSDITSDDDIITKGEVPDLPITSQTTRSRIQLPIIFSQQPSGASLSSAHPGQMNTSRKLGKTTFSSRQPKFEAHLQAIPEDEAPEILTSDCSPTSKKLASPNCKRVSPPTTTWKSTTRKLILRSVPPFPSLNSPGEK